MLAATSLVDYVSRKHYSHCVQAGRVNEDVTESEPSSWILIGSTAHDDSSYCRLPLFRKHLNTPFLSPSCVCLTPIISSSSSTGRCVDAKPHELKFNLMTLLYIFILLFYNFKFVQYEPNILWLLWDWPGHAIQRDPRVHANQLHQHASFAESVCIRITARRYQRATTMPDTTRSGALPLRGLPARNVPFAIEPRQ